MIYGNVQLAAVSPPLAVGIYPPVGHYSYVGQALVYHQVEVDELLLYWQAIHTDGELLMVCAGQALASPTR